MKSMNPSPVSQNLLKLRNFRVISKLNLYIPSHNTKIELNHRGLKWRLLELQRVRNRDVEESFELSRGRA